MVGKRARRVPFRVGSLAAALLAAGCGSLAITDKIDYGSVAPQRPLEVPPDLAPLPRDERFQVPAVASAQKSPAAAPRADPVAPPVAVARIERDGSQRWLAVDVPPEQAFEQVKALFLSVGLAIEREDPQLGIIETVWAENRARLPQDFIRRTIGRLLDSVYSTNELDKYRARIERTPEGTSEVYISHRGMVEVYTSDARERTIWQPRPSEPELEAEMLARLRLRFLPAATAGQPSATLVAVAAAPAEPPIARLVKDAEGARVIIDEPFDRAWRRVGLALDRGGFTVEDRDRALGIFFVRYIDPEYEMRERSKQGLLSRLFGRDAKVEPQQFRVALIARDGATEVRVLDREGKPEAGATGSKILSQVAEQLR
ncbi:MAG: outer membrane protein assembly factor BamC [Sutterellaceae bacterium]|nr:outer membrane protein assembly factor BamC [Burkholderiaceae bacterium]MCX7901484.1 outer membrane protein assembly factor BamC [Burkholderiaceae bacterium]MDW8430791.1 outer membrane protein assembly factor BamC [Sutterellaceae bacterium]